MVAVEQPLLFSEDMHFEHYMTGYAQLQLRIPRNTIKRDMRNVYAKKKMNLVSNFSDFKCIISDCWTNSINMGYICVKIRIRRKNCLHFVNYNVIGKKIEHNTR